MNRRFGWKKDKRDERDYKHVPSRLMKAAPDFFTLEAYLPPVRDQGNLGSCTGFGIGGNLTGVAKKLGVFSEWFSPAWIYNGGRLLAGDLAVDSGCFPRDNMEFLRQYGCLLEHFRPYKDVLDKTDPTTWPVAPEALKWPLVSYVRVTDGVDNVCDAIASGYFVSLGSPWYESWMDTDYEGKLSEDYSSVAGGHETFLYGYDKTKKIFFGQNSWGTGWGVNGRFKMPFSAFDAFLNDDGYDAHYVTVEWGAVAPPEPEPVVDKKFPWWVWAIGGAAVLGFLLWLLLK